MLSIVCLPLQIESRVGTSQQRLIQEIGMILTFSFGFMWYDPTLQQVNGEVGFQVMGIRAETEVKRVIFVERVPKASVQWNISDEEVPRS